MSSLSDLAAELKQPTLTPGAGPNGEFEEPVAPPRPLFERPQKPSAPGPVNPLAGLASELKTAKVEDDNLERGFAAYRAANTTDTPERATEVAHLAAAAKLDPLYVSQNFDVVKKGVQQDDLDRALQTRPKVLELMRQAAEPAPIKDDVAALGWLEWGITGKWRLVDGGMGTDPLTGEPQRQTRFDLVTGPAWARSLRDAVLEQEYVRLANKQLTGQADAADEARLEELEQHQNRDYGANNWFTKALVGAAKGMPYMAGNVAARVVGGASGAAVGAALGAPGVVTEAGTIPAGMAAGQHVAGAAFDFYQNVGSLWRQMRKLKREDGSPLLTDDEARAYAIPTSLALSGITSGLAGVALKGTPFGAALKKFGEKGVAAQFADRDVVHAAATFTKEWGVHATSGALIMATQAAGNTAAEQLALGQHGQEWSGQAIAEAFGHGFKTGLMDMALLTAWEPAKRLMHARGLQAHVEIEGQHLTALSDAAEASQYLDRMPQESKEAIAKWKEEHGAVKDVLHDLEAWDRHWGDKAREAAAIVMEDGGKAYDQAKATGAGELAVPVEKYVVNLLKRSPENALKLRQDAKLQPDSMTPRQLTEFMKLQEKLKERVKEVGDAKPAGPAPEQELQGIYDWMYHANLGAGRSHSQADMNAALVRDAIGSIMGSEKMSAVEVLTQFPLRVFGANGKTLGDYTNALQQAARRGGKPTDSPEFKAWFGKAAPEMRGEGGEPLTFYRGAATDEGARGGGWYSDQASAASDYAERRQEDVRHGDPQPNVTPVHIALENPLVVDARGRGWDEIRLPDDIAKKLNLRDEDGELNRGDFSTKDLRDLALQHGYDGLVVKNVYDLIGENGSKGTVVYTEQDGLVKSAIGNRGTFDPRDADVLHQLSPESRALGERIAESLTHEAPEKGDEVAPPPNPLEPAGGGLKAKTLDYLRRQVEDLQAEMSSLTQADRFETMSGHTETADNHYPQRVEVARKIKQAEKQIAKIERDLKGAGGRLSQVQNIPEWKAKTSAWMEANGYSKEQVEQHLAAIDGQMKIFSALGPVELELLPRGADLNPGPKKLREGGTPYPGGPIRANVDPIYKLTFDASALCVKRLEAGATASLIQSRLQRPLSASERMALVALFKESGKSAPCIYCYVESPRAKAAEFAGRAISTALGEGSVPKSGGAGLRALARAARAEAQRLGIKAEDIDPNYFTDPAVAASDKGIARAAKAPLVHRYVEKVLLQAKANRPKLYEEYSGQILDITSARLKELNGYAGFRFFSSSDFQAEHVADLMQAFMDLELRGAKAHAYTKVPAFAEIFGATGMKIQTSIFAKEENGQIIEDNWQGMKWGDAQRLREKFGHVGTVLVATSDNIVRWGLEQPWVDYIIPFHHSGMEKKFTETQDWQDFTSQQSEKWADPAAHKDAEGKTAKVPKVRMHELGLEGGGDLASSKETYLRLVKERGITPVFPDYLDHPGYMKLKKDYARTDTAFEPVRTIDAEGKSLFDLGRADEVLQSYLQGNEPSERPDRAIAKKAQALFDWAEKNGVDIGVHALEAVREKRKILASIVEKGDIIAGELEEGQIVSLGGPKGRLKQEGTDGETRAPPDLTDRVMDAKREMLRLQKDHPGDYNLYPEWRDAKHEHAALLEAAKREDLFIPGVLRQEERGYLEFHVPGQPGAPVQLDIHLLRTADASTFAHETAHALSIMLGQLAQRGGASARTTKNYDTLLKFMGYADHAERAAAHDESRALGARERHVEELEKAKLAAVKAKDTAKVADLDAQLSKVALTVEEQARLKFLGAREEKMSHAWEMYLLEGKSPGARLAGVFAQFRISLGKIYKTVEGVQAQYERVYGEKLELSDDVRRVFDDLLRVESETERATQGEMDFTAALKGLGEKERAKLEEVGAARKAQAEDELMHHLVNSRRSTRAAFLEGERNAIRADVEAQIDQTREFKATRLLRGRLEPGELELLPAELRGADGKPVKLDRQSIIDRYGYEYYRTLPPGVTAKEGGVSADHVAEALGFGNGDELVKGLQESRDRAGSIERTVQARMEEQYRGVMDDPFFAEKAVEAVHNVHAVHEIIEGMRAMARLVTGGDLAARFKVLDPSQMALEADRLVKGQAISEVSPARARRAELATAERAFKAAEKGDLQTAYEEKEKQLFDHFYYLMSVEARDRAEANRSYLAPFATDESKRAAIAKVGDGFLEQMDALLGSIELRQGVSGKEVRSRAGTQAWLEAQQAQNRDVVMPESVLANLDRQRSWKDLTVSELEDVRQAVESIAHIAKLKDTLLTEKGRRERRAILQELKDRAIESLGTDPVIVDRNALSFKKRALRMVKKLQAGLIRPEELIRELDGGDVNGPFSRYLWNPISDATQYWNELATRVAKPITNALTDLPMEEKLRWRNERFTIADTGQPATMESALAVALNWGNESNKTKTIEGWSSDRVAEKYGPKLQWKGEQTAEQYLSHLKRKDWEFVQTIWKSFDKWYDADGKEVPAGSPGAISLWEEAKKLEKKMTGLEPEEVKRRAFDRWFDKDGNSVAPNTPGAERVVFEGGYYPVVYDRRLSSAGARHEEATDLRSIGVFQAGYERMVTPNGHLQKRIEDFNRPTELSLLGLVRHIQHATKDVAMREALISAHDIVTDSTFRGAILQTAGEEGLKVLDKWVKDTANDLVIPDGGEGQFLEILNASRRGVTSAVFMYNAAQAIQNLAGVGNALGKVQTKYLWRGIEEIARDRGKMIAFIQSKSGEMKHRTQTQDRDVRDVTRELAGKNGMTARAKEAGMWAFQATDAAVAYPAWLGAYYQALEGKAEGVPAGDDAIAVRHADRAVRLALGAGSTKDLPALMRSPYGKWLTMFYGYASAQLNQIIGAHADASRLWQDGERYRATRRITRIYFTFMLGTILAELAVNHGPQDDDDDGHVGGADWSRWMARTAALAPLKVVPLLSTVVRTMEQGKTDASLTPLERMFGSTAGAFASAWKVPVAILNDDDWKAELSHFGAAAGEAAGLMAGLPVSQVQATGRYAMAWKAGDESPANPFEAGMGLLYGRKRKGKLSAAIFGDE